jgi:hypothetical protein
MDLCATEIGRFLERQKRRHILFVLSLQSILFMRRTRFVLQLYTLTKIIEDYKSLTLFRSKTRKKDNKNSLKAILEIIRV